MPRTPDLISRDYQDVAELWEPLQLHGVWALAAPPLLVGFVPVFAVETWFPWPGLHPPYGCEAIHKTAWG